MQGSDFLPGPAPPAVLRKLCDKLADGFERRQSSIPNAGLGIFTTRNIPKGTPVCYYAGYERTRVEMTRMEIRYAIGSPTGSTALVGYTYQRGDQPGGVAQLLNDPFSPKVEQDFPTAADAATHFRYLGRAYAEYIKRSPHEANMEDQDCVWFTNRDVCAGEELLWSYGVRYWMGNLVNSKGEATMLLRRNVCQLLEKWTIVDELHEEIFAQASGEIFAAQLMEALGNVMANEASKIITAAAGNK